MFAWLRDQKGGGSLLLAFFISVMITTLVGAVATYSLGFYQNHFRVKEAYKMIEVMEQLAKVIRRAYGRQLSDSNCAGGSSWSSSSQKLNLISSQNEPVRLCFSSRSPCVTVGGENYCLANISVDVYGSRKVRGGALEFARVSGEEAPWVARLGYRLDRVLQGLGLGNPSPLVPIWGAQRARAQGGGSIGAVGSGSGWGSPGQYSGSQLY